MSYTTNKTLPNAVYITEDALEDIRRQYMAIKLELEASEKKTKRLTKLNDERGKLFEVMKESFDLLFAENESLKETLQQKELRIRQLEEKLKNLKFKKKGRIRLDEAD